MTDLRFTSRAAVALAAAAFSLCGAGLADPPGASEAGRRPPAADAAEGPPTQEELREAMEQLMIVRMKRMLRLTPQQESRVVPRVQSLLEARREYGMKRRSALLRLRALVLDDAAEDQAIGKALHDVKTLDARFRERQEGLRDGIDAELTPRQQARFLFFEQRFRRAIEKRLQSGPRIGPPAGPPPRPPGPGSGGPPQDPFGDQGDWEEDE